MAYSETYKHARLKEIEGGQSIMQVCTKHGLSDSAVREWCHRAGVVDPKARIVRYSYPPEAPKFARTLIAEERYSDAYIARTTIQRFNLDVPLDSCRKHVAGWRRRMGQFKPVVKPGLPEPTYCTRALKNWPRPDGLGWHLSRIRECRLTRVFRAQR